jgi:Ca2+-transporting ATPase
LLGPIHIAFLEMIIDPVCSIVFEAEADEHDVMNRPPRGPDAPLFSRGLVEWSVVQGVLTLAMIAGITLYLWSSGIDEAQLRSAAFLTLVLGIMGLIVINRRFSPSIRSAISRRNPALLVVLGAVCVILLATQVFDPIADLFKFATISLATLAISVLASGAGLILLERLKPHWSKRLLA